MSKKIFEVTASGIIESGFVVAESEEEAIEMAKQDWEEVALEIIPNPQIVSLDVEREITDKQTIAKIKEKYPEQTEEVE